MHRGCELCFESIKPNLHKVLIKVGRKEVVVIVVSRQIARSYGGLLDIAHLLNRLP